MTQSDLSSTPSCKTQNALSRACRALVILGITPVDPVEQAGLLRARQGHQAILRRGSNEVAALDPLGVERCADPLRRLPPDGYNVSGATRNEAVP